MTNITAFPWEVGQLLLEDNAEHEVANSTLTDKYRFEDAQGARFKHIVIHAPASGAPLAAVCNLSTTLRFGQPFGERSPTADAYLGQHICDLHNEWLAKRNA